MIFSRIYFMMVTILLEVHSIVDHREKTAFFSKTYTKTVCENEVVELKCAEGMIEVIDAYFGRISAKKCYDGPSADEFDCPSPEGSTHKVQIECNYKRACSIPANIYFFTSGCEMNVSKYLDVTWTCVEGPPYFNRYACEHKELEINCKKKFIKIYEAFYGRTDVFKCNEKANVTVDTNTCLSKVAKTTFEVVKRCEDRHHCKLKVENDVINSCCDDPCPGIPKFLDVNYFCLSSDEL
uniref:L-rhamnose-binding lectin CSL2 n=2 Tax=Lygus hesperus TaxID=30085 RepID=A0A0A9YGH3_LYGHE